MTLKKSLLIINSKINEHAQKSVYPYTTFAIFGLITYPSYYLIWIFSDSSSYENLKLRLVAVLFCFLLLLKDYWPPKMKVFFPLCWYVTLLYSLPFLFTFFLLKNHLSYLSVLNSMTVLVLMILLLDLIALLFVSIIGILLAIICFLAIGDSIYLPPHSSPIFITYSSILFFGSLFSYRKDQLKEVVSAKENAEASSQAKTEFIANMSHDIRTPLSGIIGLSEILEKNIEDPIQKENAHMLHNSGGELLGMLNDILDDVQAGNVSENKTQLKAFDLYQCVHDLVKLEKPTTELKHLGLHVQIDPNVPQYIISDRKKIHRILLNLLGNAIKFTQSGHITIKIRNLRQKKPSTHLEFSVIDTGIGIPKKLQSKVFERFFKVNPSYKGLYAGHGLGLHIVQLYVTLLGGHIRLSSEEGLGTTFCFDISCKLPDAAAIKSLARPVKKITTLNPVTVDKTKKPYLLLIEDNEIALRVLESMMTAEAYSFKSAENAEQAFELIQAETFDLIITDIGLPGLSGNELAQRIRVWEESLKKKAIPIIGLTGHAKETAQTECLAAGMNDVLTKPANRVVLINSINKFFDQNSSAEKQSIISGVENLGYDLPSTEEQLFQLDVFPLFDPKIPLKEIDLPLLLMMLHDFISDKTQQDIQQMKQAYTNKDWVGIEKLAHKIKSGAAYLGIPRMQYACQYLERYYKAGHHLMLDKLYFQLIDVNAATINVLTAWLQEHDL